MSGDFSTLMYEVTVTVTSHTTKYKTQVLAQAFQIFV